MKTLRILAFVLSLMALPLAAQAQMQGPKGPPPCANPELTQLSAPITVASASTVLLITGAANRRIYVCGIYWSNVAAGTGQLEYGTGATCGTGTTTLTGALLGALSTPVFSQTGEPLLFDSSPGTNLCIVTAGTSPVVGGWISYVQY